MHDARFINAQHLGEHLILLIWKERRGWQEEETVRETGRQRQRDAEKPEHFGEEQTEMRREAHSYSSSFKYKESSKQF